MPSHEQISKCLPDSAITLTTSCSRSWVPYREPQLAGTPEEYILLGLKNTMLAWPRDIGCPGASVLRAGNAVIVRPGTSEEYILVGLKNTMLAWPRDIGRAGASVLRAGNAVVVGCRGGA